MSRLGTDLLFPVEGILMVNIVVVLSSLRCLEFHLSVTSVLLGHIGSRLHSETLIELLASDFNAVGVVLDEAAVDRVAQNLLVMVTSGLVRETSDSHFGADAALVDGSSISSEVTSRSGLRKDFVRKEIFIQLHLLVVLEVSKFRVHVVSVLVPVLNTEFLDFIAASVGFLRSSVEVLLLALAKRSNVVINLDLNCFHMLVIVSLVLLFLQNAVFVSTSKHLLL